MGLTLEEGLVTLLPKNAFLRPEDLVHAYRRFYADDSHRTRLFPGIAKLLAAVHTSRTCAAIVTNKGRKAIESALKQFEIFEHVSMIFSGDATLHRKPEAELYKCEIRSKILSIRDEHVLVVGDTATDLEFARNCKLDSCWVTYGYGERKACLARGPTYVANSAAELLSIVNGDINRRREGRARRGPDQSDSRERRW